MYTILEIERDDLMWLAGLLGGGGYFGYLKAGPQVKVTMSDKDVIDRAAILLKATRVREDKPTKEHYKMCYTASITGYNAERVMEMILPYMGVRRSEAIRDALIKWRSRGNNSARALRRENGLPPDCHPDKPHFTRGLCKECYAKLYNEVRRNERILVNPKSRLLVPPKSADCHPDKPLYAKGLCKSCYNVQWEK